MIKCNVSSFLHHAALSRPNRTGALSVDGRRLSVCVSVCVSVIFVNENENENYQKRKITISLTKTETKTKKYCKLKLN